MIKATHPFNQRSLNPRDENGLEGCATCGRPRSVHPGGEIERRGEHAPERPAEPTGGGRPRDHGYGYSAARKAGELDPEWVMVGVDVPAGKRLYASRDLKGSAFAVAVDESWNGDGWHLTTTMQRMLVITKPTYAECLAELMTIWQNWDSAGRELPAAGGNGKALP
jgi:hypothetical protein